MSCKRASSSTLVVILLVVFLLALDHPLAHARQLRDSSTKKGLEETRKLDVEKTKKIETVQVKGSGEKGSAHRSVVGSNSVHGGSESSVEPSKLVVIEHRGPTPHPKKHNK